MRQVHGRCKAPGCTRRAVHLHHVVYRQEVERRGGDIDDRRNLMALCQLCHFDHHARADVIPLSALGDVHLDYAFELLGAFAYDYLQRRYDGRDSRLDDELARGAA